MTMTKHDAAHGKDDDDEAVARDGHRQYGQCSHQETAQFGISIIIYAQPCEGSLLLRGTAACMRGRSLLRALPDEQFIVPVLNCLVFL